MVSKPHDPAKGRMVQDFLLGKNKCFCRAATPIPAPWQVWQRVDPLSTCFFSANLSASYYQIPINKESQPYTTFMTDHGSFAMTRLAMGLSASSDAFNHKVGEVFDEYLWNAGGKRNRIPEGETPPCWVMINNVRIYIQYLLSQQANNTQVVGWDKLLASIQCLKPEASDQHVAAFWARWKQQLHQTQRALGKSRKVNRSPTVEKTFSHPNGDPNTPKESCNTKRKQDFAPDSNEPLAKGKVKKKP